MMTKIFLLALLLPFFCTQQDFQIKKVWLFSKTEYSGNVPRMPGGQQLKGINKKLFGYVEVGKDQPMPKWQNAYFNGNSYSVVAVPLSQDSVAVGTDNKTKTAIVLVPANGDKIIQLMFTLKPADTVSKTNDLVLDGALNNKAVHLKPAGPVTELTPDMMP